MEKIVLTQEGWNYSLCKEGGRYLLSVVCGGVGLFEVEVEIPEDVALRGVEDKAQLEPLVAAIRANPDGYRHAGIVGAPAAAIEAPGNP